MHAFIFKTESPPGGWHVEVQGRDLQPVGYIRCFDGGYAYHRKGGAGHPLLTAPDLESVVRGVRALEAGTSRAGNS